MTIFDMLEQSGVMTVLGMGIVFSFLLLMVFVISGLGIIMSKFTKKEAACQAASGSFAGNDANVTAAIGAAVNEYKKNK